jgi:hypothetical protein
MVRVRRKGEVLWAIDREYPHQVLLRADHYTGSAYRTVQAFCIGLSLAPRGHSIFKDDMWQHVSVFRIQLMAEQFRARFGVEVFEPMRRSRGKRWHLPKALKG